MAMREVLAAFGITIQGLDALGRADAAIKGTEKSSISLNDSIRQLAGAFGIGLGVAGAGAWFHSFTEGAGEVRALSAQLGQSTADVQAWMAGAEMMGSKAGDVENAMFALSESIGMAGDASSATGERAMALKALGVSVKTATGGAKDMSSILSELGTSFDSIEDPIRKAYLAQQIMGDAGVKLLPVLSGIADRTAEIKAAGGGYDDEAMGNVADFRREAVRLDMAWRRLQSTFFNKVAPAVTSVAEALSRASTNVAKWVGGTDMMAVSLVALSPLLYDVGAAAVAAFGPALLKTSLWSLAILAVALAVEDFLALIEGRSSVFEKIFGKEAADTVREYWTAAVMGAVRAVEIAINAWNRLKAELTGGEYQPTDLGMGTEGGTADSIAQAQVAHQQRMAAMDARHNARQAMWAQGIDPDAVAAAASAGDSRAFAPSAQAITQAPGAPTTAQQITATDARSQTVNVYVEGAADPVATGKAVASKAQAALDTRALLGANMSYAK